MPLLNHHLEWTSAEVAINCPEYMGPPMNPEWTNQVFCERFTIDAKILPAPLPCPKYIPHGFFEHEGDYIQGQRDMITSGKPS